MRGVRVALCGVLLSFPTSPPMPPLTCLVGVVLQARSLLSTCCHLASFIPTPRTCWATAWWWTLRRCSRSCECRLAASACCFCGPLPSHRSRCPIHATCCCVGAVPCVLLLLYLVCDGIAGSPWKGRAWIGRGACSSLTELTCCSPFTAPSTACLSSRWPPRDSPLAPPRRWVGAYLRTVLLWLLLALLLALLFRAASVALAVVTVVFS